MKFRHHRGGLKESMNTTVEVQTIDELKRVISFNVEDVKFEYAGMDERTGWNTFYVLAKRYGRDEFHVAGMSDSEL